MIKTEKNQLINLEKLQLIMIICFSLITFLLYTPSGLFLGNIDEFPVDYKQAFPIIVTVIVAAGLLLACIGFVFRKNEKLYYIFVDLIFGITIGAYVQGNFLNGNLPRLDGREYNWNENITLAVISTILWILCLVIPFIVRAFSKKLQTRIVIGASGLLSAMQIVALIVMLLGTERTVDNNIAVTKENEFMLSTNNNVIVFVVDTLDSQWAETYILDDPKYDGLFTDFTYYDNVVGGGAPTVLGIPALLTGELYNPEISLDVYYKQAYANSSLFRDLKTNGYVVNLFTEEEYLNHADIEHIDNTVADSLYISEPIKFAKNLMRLTAYYLSPYIMKEKLSFETSAFSSCYSTVDSVSHFYIDDPQFYLDFKNEGLSITEEGHVFSLYHLFGAHGPYTMDENGARVEQSSWIQQIHGDMKIIGDYIAELKSKGVYENSTIIIVADHGGVSLYQNPALFVKQANENKAFSINSDPLTFEEVRATFVSGLPESDREKYGKNLKNYTSEDLKEWRMLTADSVLKQKVFPDMEKGHLRYSQFLIGNPARDDSLIQPVESSRFYYSMGTVIAFTKKDLGALMFSDLSQREENGTWTNGEKLEMPFALEGYQGGDLVLRMSFSTFDGEQRVFVSANDQMITEYTADGDEEIEIMIPAEYLDNNTLNLCLQFPDAHSPASINQSEDDRILALKLHSIMLSEA